jgi:signal transduction histidine kinase
VYLVDPARKRINLEFDNGRVIGLLETNYKAWNSGLGGVVYRTGQSVLLNAGDNTTPPENTMILNDASGISQIVVPLQTGGKTIGTAVVSSQSEVYRFTWQDDNLFLTLAGLAATALENARLSQSEQDRRRVAESMVQAGRKLSGDYELQEVPSRILAQLAMVVPYERGSLMLQEGDVLRIAAQQGFPPDPRVKELRISIREGDVFQQVSSAGKPVMIDDVTQVSGWQQVSWLPLNRSWMGVPLFTRDRVIGMISLTRRDAGAFSHDDSQWVSTFALQAAIALENAGLYEEVTRFNQHLEKMVQIRTEELHQALQSLERLDKNKTDFISVAAHELRTPLTVMKGYTAMLEADPAVKAKPYLTDSVKGVLSGTERLHEIVNSMLDVARIDNQVLDPHPEITSIGPIIRRIQADLVEDLAGRKLTLQVGDLSGLPKLNADPTMLLKVFQNVILNAVKFTPDGGKITVTGRHVTDETLGDCVEVMVQDTGIGIDPDHHELIFEKFYQTGKVALHSSGKTIFKGGGPGLGLAIARGIVQAHKGRIWVASERHDEEHYPGSCFHILLPVARD